MNGRKQISLCGIPLSAGLLAGLLLVLSAQTSMADDEIRAGAMLQIPFNLSSSRSFFDPGAIRVGLTCQYVDVEEDEITLTRHITNNYVDGTLQGSSESGTVTRVDEGNRVYGVEGNVFVTVFGNWNISAELLGLYGTNDVQGAVGAGYGLAESFFLDTKVMFPYSEVGLRFLGGAEVYGGIKTLGHFNPAKEYRRFTVTTNNYNYTPQQEIIVEPN